MRKEPIMAVLAKESVLTEDSNESKELYAQSRYGTQQDSGKLQLSLLEAAYLVEKGKLDVLDGRNHTIPFEKLVKKAKKTDKNFWVRYCVFKDIRNRGYIIKTALKFGADFRIYPRGVKPGEAHAKWVVYPVHETQSLTWHEFSAKNRVAHSTKKKLLIGVVDEENDVTYYEVKWVKP